MYMFSAIVCLALIATATAQGGYNYQQPKPIPKQTYRPPAPIGNNGIYSGQQAPPLPSFNAPGPIRPNYPAPPAPSNTYVPSSPQSPAPQYGAPYQQQQQQQNSYGSNYGGGSNSQHQQQTIVSKDIYIHSGPEETEEIHNGPNGADAGPLRKNYRIVFIKAPSHNVRIHNNIIKQSQAANEEKTIIYVLSKKPEITNIQNQISSPQGDQSANKPEVYFIKYKTQEEAARAQQEIQAQYDALGGSTRVSDEGIAPVTSVIGGGSAGGGGPGSSGSASSSSAAYSNGNNQQNFGQSSYSGNQGSASSQNFGIEAPSNKYLPAKKK